MSEVTDLGGTEVVQGQGGKETTINENMNFVAAAASAFATVDVAGSTDVTLTAAENRALGHNLTGVQTGNLDAIIENKPRAHIVKHSATGGFTVTYRTAGDVTSVAFSNGNVKLIYCDGADNVYALT